MTAAARARMFDLVVCGGGASGSAIAHKFTRQLGNGKVCVIEPSEIHYYQPMWTLIGGGHKRSVPINVLCVNLNKIFNIIVCTHSNVLNSIIYCKLYFIVY